MSSGTLRRVAGRPWRDAQTLACRALFERGRLETDVQVHPRDLGLGDRFEGYAPSGWRWVHRALRGEPITRDDVFVDFGSGKGRVVGLVARRYPFGRVVGVEIAPELTTVARENLARAHGRLRCPHVELVTADATEWPVPDDMTHAYLYNPFRGEALERLLANIVASLDRKPRRLTLIYANPMDADAVLATGRFRLVRTSRGLRRDLPLYTIAVFHSV